MLIIKEKTEEENGLEKWAAVCNFHPNSCSNDHHLCEFVL